MSWSLTKRLIVPDSLRILRIYIKLWMHKVPDPNHVYTYHSSFKHCKIGSHSPIEDMLIDKQLSTLGYNIHNVVKNKVTVKVN